jgi:hypothetical protein
VVAEALAKVVRHEDEKWLKYFLSQRQIDLRRALRTCGAATTLDKVCLGRRRSRHRQERVLVERAERVHLLQLGRRARRSLPKKALQYVAGGEANGYHAGYKCSVRAPW